MIAEYLSRYTSATLAAGGTQTLIPSDGEPKTARVYNRLYVEGTFDFSFLFSPVTDSTFGDGSRTPRNFPAEPWTLFCASVSVCQTGNPEEDTGVRTQLRFEGSPEKKVAEGEIFASDPVSLEVKRGEYLSLEIHYAGSRLPCHEESIVPVFQKSPDGWVPSSRVPIPSMTGCSRKVSTRVCFLGDSITQGIGTPVDSYKHYAAVTAERIGFEGIAYWDIGLGWARAEDAASGGVWIARAKRNDVVSVCLGVNDLLQGRSDREVIASLLRIVSDLKEAGCRVLVQTLPPFDYEGSLKTSWETVNRFILTDPVLNADAVFDCVPLLGQPGQPEMARYGGHPDPEGCRIWAEALAPVLKALIDRTK